MADRRSALDEARDAVLEREQLREERRASGTDPEPGWDRRWVAAAVLSWATVIWMMVAPAGPFRRPEPQRFSTPPHLTEASLRYGIWLAAVRVDRFVARMQRLPIDLEEVGVNDRTLRLTPGSGPRSYVVTGSVSNTTVAHRSDEPLGELLGESVDRLVSGR